MTRDQLILASHDDRTHLPERLHAGHQLGQITHICPHPILDLNQINRYLHRAPHDQKTQTSLNFHGSVSHIMTVLQVSSVNWGIEFSA